MKNITLVLSMIFYCSTAFAVKQAERSEEQLYSFSLFGISLSMTVSEAKSILEKQGFKSATKTDRPRQQSWQYSKGMTKIIISKSQNDDRLNMLDVMQKPAQGSLFNIEDSAARISENWRSTTDDPNSSIKVCQTRSGITGKRVVFGSCSIKSSQSNTVGFHANLNQMQIHQRLVRFEKIVTQ